MEQHQRLAPSLPRDAKSERSAPFGVHLCRLVGVGVFFFFLLSSLYRVREELLVSSGFIDVLLIVSLVLIIQRRFVFLQKTMVVLLASDPLEGKS